MTTIMVKAVETYLRDHLAEPVTVDDLARVVGYSKYHFIRKFAAQTGYSPGRYLTRARMSAAAHLLATTRLPVGEVCRRVGWESISTFPAAFRTRFGCSPTEYRRSHAPAPGPPARGLP